jgi:hypothetical protein
MKASILGKKPGLESNSEYQFLSTDKNTECPEPIPVLNDFCNGQDTTALNVQVGNESTETSSQSPYSLEFIAKQAHQAVRQFNLDSGQPAQVEWDNATESDRDSTIAGVLYYINNPKATAEEVHQHWLERKLEEGWSCGETKDPEAKTHPCMRPYSELTLEHKLKDHIFMYVVGAFLEAYGEEHITKIPASDSDLGWYDNYVNSSTPTVGVEGFGSFFKKLLGIKTEDKDNQLTKNEESDMSWLDKYTNDDVLTDAVKAKTTKFSVGKNPMFVKDNKPVTSVAEFMSELDKDINSISSIMSRYGSIAIKADKIVADLNKQAEKAKDYDTLRSVILKFKDKLPKSLAETVKQDKTKLLGNSVGLLNDDGEIALSTKPFNQEIMMEPATLEELNKLLSYWVKLGEVWRDIEVDHVSGLDFTDPPFRGYSDELSDDDEVMEILNSYLHPTFDENFDIIYPLENRTWELMDACITLIRKATNTTTTVGNEGFIDNIKDLWFAITANKEEKEKRYQEQAAKLGNIDLPTAKDLFNDIQMLSSKIEESINDTFLYDRWVDSRTLVDHKIKISPSIVVNNKLLSIDNFITQTRSCISKLDSFSSFVLEQLDRKIPEMVKKNKDITIDELVTFINDEITNFSSSYNFKVANMQVAKSFTVSTAKSNSVEIDPIPLGEFKTYGNKFKQIYNELEVIIVNTAYLYATIGDMLYQTDLPGKDSVLSKIKSTNINTITDNIMDIETYLLECLSGYWKMLNDSVTNVK